MHPLRILFLLVAFFLAPAISSAALELPKHPEARINDYARALRTQDAATLEERFARFEQQTGHQAVVAIFSEIEGWTIEDFASKLYEKWRLGSKDKDDGVLLVFAMKERGLRIEVGYGLEGQLTDAQANQIIQRDMVPLLKRGELAAAILAFEQRLEDVFIKGQKLPSQNSPTRNRGPRPISLLAVVLFLLFFVLPRLGDHTIGARGLRHRRRGLFGIFPPDGSGGFGGGGFGGFGGGGGGMSGGGGSSGRW